MTAPTSPASGALPAHIRTLLEECQRWHNGSEWRNDKSTSRREAWQAHRNAINAALASREVSSASLTEGERAELDQLRLLAGGNSCIAKVQELLGPMSLWSKQGLEDHIEREVAARQAALASPQVAPALTEDDPGWGWKERRYAAIKAHHTHDFGQGPVLSPSCISDALREGFVHGAAIAAPAPVAPTEQGQNPRMTMFEWKAHAKKHRMRFDIASPAEGVGAAPVAPTPAATETMPCEDCGGCGEVGEERYQGDFQPPERSRCSSCDGSGVWQVAPTPAAQMEEVGVMDYGTNTNVRWRNGLTQGTLPAGTRLYRAAEVAPTPAQPSQWQPIETAPREKKTVLLRDGEGHHADGYWLREAYAGSGAWMWPFAYATPTHWMPLPSEPEGEAS
jgi:hypothetical protein